MTDVHKRANWYFAMFAELNECGIRCNSTSRSHRHMGLKEKIDGRCQAVKKQVKRLTSIQRKADVPPYAERTRSKGSNKESLSFGNFLSKELPIARKKNLD